MKGLVGSSGRASDPAHIRSLADEARVTVIFGAVSKT